MGSKKGMGFKPRGIIKGPGSGTSDDIQADVPQGSYIMPADSTQQLGAERLSGLGMSTPRVPAEAAAGPGPGFNPGRVPVNVSNGEFALPPEQVHAVGVQALNAMRDATHDPVPPAAVARNGSELFFANGGVVNPDEEKKSGQLPAGVTRSGNSYSDVPSSSGATPSQPAAPTPPTTTTPDNTGAEKDFGNPAATVSPAPQPGTGAPRPYGTTSFLDGYANSAPEIGLGVPRRASPDSSANANANAAEVPQSAGSRGLDSNAILGDSRAVIRGATQDVNSDLDQGNYARAVGTATRGALAMVPALSNDFAGYARNNLFAQGVKGFAKGLFGVSDAKPSDTAGVSQSAPAPAAPAAVAASTTTPSTSASPAANGTFNMVEDAMRRGANMGKVAQSDIKRVGNSYSGVNIGPNATINGKEPGGGFAVVPSLTAGATGDQFHAPSIQAPQATGFVGISDPRRNALRDQVLSAALNPLPGSQHGQLTANQLRTAQGVLGDEQRTQAQADQTAANNAAAMERQSMQEAGANARFAASNALDRQRVGLDQQRVGLDAQERSLKIAEAQRMADLQKQYEENPDKREEIAKRIRDLSGRETNDKFMAVQGGQEFDPVAQAVVTRPASVFNTTTHQFVERPQSLPPIDKNPAAVAIKNDTTLSREQRVAKLRALGYQ